MNLYRAKLGKNHRGNPCTVSSTGSFADAPVQLQSANALFLFFTVTLYFSYKLPDAFFHFLKKYFEIVESRND